ncbi:alpha/beta hydrolase [Actinoplanes sp. NPDC049596]|uniref:alpha/beta hydrolase n=1 Tax=unclassified Actinoplanes TaxID=2626549 RepID=UPI0034288F47
MSEITLRMLFDVDTAAIGRRAEGWLRMANSLDDACEELIRASRDLENVWPSGDTAVRRSADLRAEASNSYPPCRRIGDALRLHADTLRGLQDQVRAVAAEASGRGFSVDVTTGTVQAPSHMFTESASPQIVAQSINAYVNEFQAILARAAESDASTANTIAVNVPDPAKGFGTLGMPPVSEQTLRDQQGRTPRQVNDWWRSLTPEQQERALQDHPELVGWLDGVPSSDRDVANRLVLADRKGALQTAADQHAARLARLLVDDPYNEIDIQRETEAMNAAQDQLGKLAEVDRALQSLGEQGLLLGVDPAGDGRVVIAVNDPDTARHTGVWVPGLGTTMEGNTVGNVERMQQLNLAADRHTLGEAGDVSTVYWLGYDAPDLNNLSVAMEGRSEQGGPRYLNFMEGMRATHDAGPSHLVAMGHSYGSTVVAEAALTKQLPVDDILVQGSPGMHTEHAADLMADPRHVWAGSAGNDPVAETSNVTKWTQFAPIVGPFIGDAYDDGHGVSPHEASFGANEYRVDTSGHTHYWEPNSESLDNQARVLAGQYSFTTRVHGDPPPDVVP